MLVFRILCAVLMAWAANWSLSRPEAVAMLETLPEMRLLGPIAAAVVGFFNLAVRQGWGFIVAFANGIWAGVLAILLSGVMSTIIAYIQSVRVKGLQSFENFMFLFGESVQPMIDQLANVPLLIVSLGASAIVGVATEVIHWVLVRMRTKKGARSGSSSGA